MLLLLLGVFTEGRFALWCIVGIGLFNSIMFPNIFTLAIKGLKEYTTQGSALLVMGIVGGALIPPLQEFLLENENIGIQKSFLLPVICYLYIAFYGLYGYRQTNSD